jgi:hypothetical protein
MNLTRETKYKNRTIELRGDSVSCVTCAVNYDSKGEPKYCQEFNMPIDLEKVDENHERGFGCRYYCPKGLDRSVRVIAEKSDWQK